MRCRAWADALQKYGTITLSQALQPAIRYAERGFPVSPRLNADITESKKKVAADPELARIFLPNGEAPPIGSLLKQPELARTLRVDRGVGSGFRLQGHAREADRAVHGEGRRAADGRQILRRITHVGKADLEHVHGQSGDRVPA